MKSIITLMLLFSLSSQCFGQVNYFSKRNYIEEGLKPFDFEINDENGTFVVGNNGPSRAFCSYQNEEGLPLWSRRFIPLESFIGLENVIRLYDSTFLLVGTMRNPLNSRIGATCIRMNKYGDTLWAKTIDDGSGLAIVAQDVIQLKDSNILITGSIIGAWSFAFKLDLNGNKIWGKTYYFDPSQPDWTHEIITVKEHANGQLTFAGRQMNQSPVSSYIRGFVMKTESNGETIWSKNIYNGNTYLDDVIIEDSFYYFLNSGSSDLIKTDSLMNIIWDITVADGNQFYDETRTITVLHDSSMLITWHDLSNGYVQRISKSGIVIDGAVIIGQSIRTLEDKDSSILILSGGPLYGLKSLITQNHFGLYKADSLLNSTLCIYENPPWSQTNVANVSSNWILWQDQLDIYNTTFNMEDIFLTNEENCVELFGEIEENNLINFEVFPNPFTNQFTIKKNNNLDAIYLLSDCSGRILLKGKILNGQTDIDTQILSSGNYFIQVEGITRKVIKN